MREDSAVEPTWLTYLGSVLGQEAIENIMVGAFFLGSTIIIISPLQATDMNEKGKGKYIRPGPKVEGPRHPSHGDGKAVNREKAPAALHPVCGICMEPFQATHSPSAAIRSANSSARMQFGIRLTCPQSHGYCISCLNSYINSKLDPDGTGLGNPNAVVFPIRCPECPVNEWPEGLSDEVAEKVLTDKGMTLWVSSGHGLRVMVVSVRNTNYRFTVSPEALR